MSSTLFLSVCALLGCESAGFRREYMALDGLGHRRRDVFYTDTDAIYCIAELASGRDDVTVQARLYVEEWFSPIDGASIEFDGLLASEEQAPGRGDNVLVAFQWEREGEEPYPAGRFRCDLLLDGELEGRLQFEVRYSDCPLAPIVSGQVCQGFVLQGETCEGALGEYCWCDGEVWSCG